MFQSSLDVRVLNGRYFYKKVNELFPILLRMKIQSNFFVPCLNLNTFLDIFYYMIIDEDINRHR